MHSYKGVDCYSRLCTFVSRGTCGDFFFFFFFICFLFLFVFCVFFNFFFFVFLVFFFFFFLAEAQDCVRVAHSSLSAMASDCVRNSYFAAFSFTIRHY